MTTDEKEEEAPRYKFKICDEHGNTIIVNGFDHQVVGEGTLKVWDGYNVFEAAPRGWSWIQRLEQIHMVKKQDG